MKQIFLVRHGESEGNAGLPSNDPARIPLTKQGKVQAEEVPKNLPWSPELIAVSPFLRARQTAEPSIRQYPHVPVETWTELHEFTYLAPARCAGTTAIQRKPWVDAYWSSQDPSYLDGDGAESFDHLISRAMDAIQRIHQCPQERILIFSHEQFLKILKDILTHPHDSATERMARFHKLPHIRNCEGSLITINDKF